MANIILKANRLTPGIPTVGNDLDSHTRVLQAVAEAIAIHERRTKDLLNSFVRVEELIDLGLLELTGTTLSLSDSIGDGGGGGSGVVEAIVEGTGIDVDATDPANPIVSLAAAIINATFLTETDESATFPNSRPLVAGTNISIGVNAYGELEISASASGSGSASALAAQILADSPIGYWKCDEASGTLNDYGSANVDLTSSGTVTYQAAPLIPGDDTPYVRIASGGGFSATSGLGLSYPITGSHTIEGLIRPINNAGALSLFGIGGSGELEAANFQCRLNVSGGDWQSFWESGAGTDRTAAGYGLGAPDRYHIAMVKDAGASQIRFYLNGVLLVTAAMPTNTTGGTGTLFTGIGQTSGGTSTADFIVGHVAFYNTALSAARILAHANAAGF